jgi:hypothetical protein
MTIDANDGAESSAAPNTDANNSESSSDALGEVVLDPEHFDDNSDNLIPTVEDDIGGIDLTTGGARETSSDAAPSPDDEGDGGDAGTETEGKEAEAEEETDTPPDGFHKHPAWQRILKERDEARLELEKLKNGGVLDAAAAEKPAAEEMHTEEFNKISQMSEDELLEFMSENPKEYTQYLIQIAKNEAKAEISAETEQKQIESKIDATYDAYAEKNPANEDGTGFVEMWESGKIKEFIEKNPGHNPISAHMALTADTRLERAVKAAEEAAAAKVKEEFKKSMAARKITDGLSGGPGYVPADEDAALKDTKRHGGVAATLAERLAARRRQAV